MPEQKPERGKQQPFSPEEYIERVRMRAYEIYVARGGRHGRDTDDWLEAEKQVRKEMGLKD